MQAEPTLGRYKQQSRFDNAACRDHDGNAPAAVRAGIGRIGWHTLRHTYSTLLHEFGAPLAVQKELLRHSDIQTTMNVYGRAMTDGKRQAHSNVVEMILKPASENSAKTAEAGENPASNAIVG